MGSKIFFIYFFFIYTWMQNRGKFFTSSSGQIPKYFIPVYLFFYCLACFTATLIVYRVIFLSKILSSVVKFNFKAKSVMSMGMFHETFVFFR